jgi:hypothetical protein
VVFNLKTNKMEDEFITFEIAKLAKEKGFVLKTGINYYSDKENDMAMSYDLNNINHYPCETQSLLQRWLREIHGLHIHLYFIDHILGYNSIITNLKTNTKLFKSKPFIKYEQALEEGLYEALKLIKN